MILAWLSIALLCLCTIYSAIVAFRQKPDAENSSWIFPLSAGRRARGFAGALTLVFFIAVIALLNKAPAGPQERSLRFLIPEGYTGWVRVEFEVAGAPPLPVESGQTVAKLPPTGVLSTSSPEQYGWAEDTYYFYSQNGIRPVPSNGPQRMIWGKINGEASGPSGKRKYEEFFVGTEQQFREQANPGEQKSVP